MFVKSLLHSVRMKGIGVPFGSSFFDKLLKILFFFHLKLFAHGALRSS